MVHNPDKNYRSIDPMPMSQVDAEQYADKAHNIVAMHIDDAVRMFADDADASWDLLKIKSTLREGEVVDLAKFRADKEAAKKRSQPTAPPPDDDEVAAITLQSLFDKLITTGKWKHLFEKQDHIFMQSVWQNKETKERIELVVTKVNFHDMHMNVPASDVTVEYDNGLEIDGEEFYSNL